MKANSITRELSESFPTKGYVRRKQVAAYLSVSETTVWRMVKTGKLPKSKKLSSRVAVWNAEEIIEWARA